MRSRAARPALPSTEAIFTVPSFSMSIVVPVSSVIARMTAPPLPMTSRIFSGSILIVMIVGAHSDIFSRGVRSTLFISPRMCSRPSRACAKRRGHDLARNAEDLDVHLQRGDAFGGAGHLEVHVAEVVLVAEDVGEHGEAVVLFDQAHRDAGDRSLDRHARVHQRQARAAHARHRARTVRLGDVRHHANHVRIGFHVGHDGLDAAPSEPAVADFAALRRADKSGLANAIRREIVVQHERIAPLAFERVDDLRVAAGAERGDDERLRLASGEDCRSVSPGQNAHLHVDLANRFGVAAVDAGLTGDDPAANDLALRRRGTRPRLARPSTCRLRTHVGGHALLLELADLRVADLLLRDAVGVGELRDELARRAVVSAWSLTGAAQMIGGRPASFASDRIASIAICICSWPNITAPSITSSDSIFRLAIRPSAPRPWCRRRRGRADDSLSSVAVGFSRYWPSL